MSKLLFITANVKEVKDSNSLTIGQEFIKEYKQTNPSDEIVCIDLFKANIPFLDAQLIGTLFGKIKPEELDVFHQKQFEIFNKNLEEFMSADKYVFAFPLWNLSVPPILKAYFDNVTVIGKTVIYTEAGPKGQLEGKKAVCINSSGGVYSSGPAAAFEHGVSYVKSILMFMGVTDIETILAEGLDMHPPEEAEKIKQNIIANAKTLATKF